LGIYLLGPLAGGVVIFTGFLGAHVFKIGRQGKRSGQKRYGKDPYDWGTPPFHGLPPNLIYLGMQPNPFYSFFPWMVNDLTLKLPTSFFSGIYGFYKII
jgi:hypothetical protein